MTSQYNAAYTASLVKVAARRPLTSRDMTFAHLFAAAHVGAPAPQWALVELNAFCCPEHDGAVHALFLAACKIPA